MTRGQRALNDLEIILDDAGLEHDEIIQGWIGKIAAELAAAPATTAECDRLRETNRQLVKACEALLNNRGATETIGYRPITPETPEGMPKDSD